MENQLWGKTADGEDVFVYELCGAKGMRVRVMNYGANLLALEVPLPDGTSRDVLLGYENLEDYFDNPPCYGCTVGRNANRIGGAQFTLHGKTYELDKNDGENNLHSGFHPLHKRIWKTENQTENAITFSYDSPNGDMGFPGAMKIDVTYTLTDNALVIDYHAKANADTVFNPTNHSYFNLKGQGNGNILDHTLTIYADMMTPTDEASIPHGEMRSLENMPLDFRTTTVVGARINDDYDQLNYASGYDHNYVLRKDSGLNSAEFSTAKSAVSHAATLAAPDRSLVMDVYTDCPGLQLYTGNFISEDETGKGGVHYPSRGGIALETQHFPNCLNVPSFPQSIIKANEDAYTRTVYQFHAEDNS